MLSKRMKYYGEEEQEEDEEEIKGGLIACSHIRGW